MRRRLILLSTLSIGCGSTKVNIPPIASLTAAPNPAKIGAGVTLDGSGSSDPDGVVTSWRFVFTDGSSAVTSTSPTIVHAFPRGGQLTVELFVTDDGGATSSTTASVTILDAPDPIGCTQASDCQPDELCQDGTCVIAATCDATQACTPPLVCDGALCDCPGGAVQCGGACCDGGQSCVAGVCAVVDSCAPLESCGGVCVNEATDPTNCGGCGVTCTAPETCESGCVCAPPDMICPDGSCVDVTSDPMNCGFCGNVCPSGQCTGTQCVPTMTMPSGTVIATFPLMLQSVEGLATDGKTLYALTNSREVDSIDPTSLLVAMLFHIQNENMDRAYGLAYENGNLFTGSYPRNMPLSEAELDTYDLSGNLSGAQPKEGGPCASDGKTLYVFDNPDQQLVTLAPGPNGALVETSRNAVSGLNATDVFTDLGLDGKGGVWAVRPQTMGMMGPVLPALMQHIDLATMSVDNTITPPDTGLGGIELMNGALWGASPTALYEMVP